MSSRNLLTELKTLDVRQSRLEEDTSTVKTDVEAIKKEASKIKRLEEKWH